MCPFLLSGDYSLIIGYLDVEFKVCNQCKKRKPVDEFNWRRIATGLRQFNCRDCQHKQVNAWYQQNREDQVAKAYKRKLKRREVAQEYVLEYLKSHPCSTCGKSDSAVLEFHHVQGEKRKEVARMVNHGYALKTIQAEIDKCIVLCANCHKRITYEGSWRE